MDESFEFCFDESCFDELCDELFCEEFFCEDVWLDDCESLCFWESFEVSLVEVCASAVPPTRSSPVTAPGRSTPATSASVQASRRRLQMCIRDR